MSYTARAYGTAVIGTQSANTVVAGPFKIENFCSVLMTTKSLSTVSVPTAYKLQVSADPAGATGTYGDIPSNSVTASTSSGAVVATVVNNIPATYIQVVSGAAFGSGTATLQVYVLEQI